MINELSKQIDFLIEVDKLKGVNRRSWLVDRSRHENSAEHSWHVALCASILSPFADDNVDLSRVIRMLLVHDIVEIDAGDTFAYDDKGKQDQHDRELAASERLFGILPDTQAEEYKSLWIEFEEKETSESRFANAIDRIMPLLHNYYTAGISWKKHSITKNQVLERVSVVRDEAPILWQYVTDLVDDAVAKEYLLP